MTLPNSVLRRSIGRIELPTLIYAGDSTHASSLLSPLRKRSGRLYLAEARAVSKRWSRGLPKDQNRFGLSRAGTDPPTRRLAGPGRRRLQEPDTDARGPPCRWP